MYLAMKLVHILATVVFLGNILTAVFWKLRGDRSRDPAVIRHTLEGVIQADRVFTMPGSAVLAIAGFGAAGIGRYPIMETGWILWSIVLYVISAVLYMAFVSPAQKRMLRAISSDAGGSVAWDRYESESRKWNLWGTLSTLAIVAAAVLMVLKPQP